MQAARSAFKLLRATALCSVALCSAAAVYMSATEHYDDALARMEKSVELFIVFIVVCIGFTLALASFISNLMVGHSSRDDRVLLAMKLKECVAATQRARDIMTCSGRYIVTHLAMASFLSGERSFGHPGDIFESSLWMMWCSHSLTAPLVCVSADVRPLVAGLAATLCRLHGCKCLGCACRAFAAAPTLAATARTSSSSAPPPPPSSGGACCCCHWLLPHH